MHNITIVDNIANWERWGALVRDWVANPANQPTTVAQLKAAMTAATVSGSVVGPDSRGVTCVNYTDAGNIVIPLPTPAMMTADETLLDGIATQPIARRLYPLPGFYPVIFGGSPRVPLTAAQLRTMGLQRLGEYVINECM